MLKGLILIVFCIFLYIFSMSFLNKIDKKISLIVIDNAHDFERTIQIYENRENVFVLFTAKINSKTGKSWCKDSDKAAPIIAKVFNEFGSRVIFIKCYVSKKEFKNKEYIYRTHPHIKLNRIPTLVHWGGEYEQIIESQLLNDKTIVNFVITHTM